MTSVFSFRVLPAVSGVSSVAARAATTAATRAARPRVKRVALEAFNQKAEENRRKAIQEANKEAAKRVAEQPGEFRMPTWLKILTSDETPNES